MAPRVSDFASTLEPDAPIVQSATYRMDAGDRQYIDGQITQIQALLAAGFLNGVIASYYPAGGAVNAGDVVCLTTSATGIAVVVQANSTNMTGQLAVTGIAMTAAASGAMVAVAVGGDLPQSLTSLTGALPYVRVSSAGRCQQVAAYTPGDFPVGIVNSSGVLSIARDIRGATQGNTSVASLTCIGNASIGGSLGVVGACSLASGGAATTTGGDCDVGGNCNVTGNVVCSGTMAVSGNATFSGALTVSGTNAVSLNPNTAIGGTLAVSSTTNLTGAVTCGAALTVASTLTASGNAHVVSQLNVDGASTLTGAVSCGTTLGVSSNATVGGTLGVTGACSLATGGGLTKCFGALTVVGAVTCDGGLSMSACSMVGAVSALAYTATLNLDWSKGNTVDVGTLTGGITLTWSGVVDGGTYYLRTTQDGTGGRTLTWSPGGSQAIVGGTLSLGGTLTAGAITIWQFLCRQASGGALTLYAIARNNY